MRIIYVLSAFLLIFVFSCKKPPPSVSDLVKPEEIKKVKDGIFIHVSSGYENPKQVLMALNMANKMAEFNDVCLFFDNEGVKLLTQSSEDIQMELYMPLHESLEKLIAIDVRIMACPTSVKAAGIEPEQLKSGIIIAEKEKFFNFTKGRILTLDY